MSIKPMDNDWRSWDWPLIFTHINKVKELNRIYGNTENPSSNRHCICTLLKLQTKTSVIILVIQPPNSKWGGRDGHVHG